MLTDFLGITRIQAALDVANDLVGASIDAEFNNTLRLALKIGYGRIFGVRLDPVSQELDKSDDALYFGGRFRLW